MLITLLVGMLAAATIAGLAERELGTSMFVLDIAAGLLGCALVPVCLRWPVAGSLAAAALAGLSPVATAVATVSVLLVAERRRFSTAAWVAGVGIAAHLAQNLWRPAGGLSFSWWLALIVAGYAALVGWGAWTQARRALVASLEERARRAEAEQGRRVAEARIAERAQIAREMHDVLAHRLSLIATYAGALEYRPDSPPEQLARAAGVVRTGVHQALDELRTVISVLRDEDEVSDDAAVARPQPVLADVPRLVAESHDAGQQVSFDNRMADDATVPPIAGRAAYRIVQEGLTNARKHAAGQPVRVVLDGKPGAMLTIEIKNPLPRNGHAMPIVPGSGAGLVGLTERVHLAGGELDHEVTATGEFHLCARLPWPK